MEHASFRAFVPMRRFLFLTLRLLPLLLAAACASSPEVARRSAIPAVVEAERDLKQARRVTLPAEKRAGFFLAAAEETERFATGGEPERGREIYNNATAELTALLREADGGRWWKREQSLAGPRGNFRLRIEGGVGEFDRFIVARGVNQRRLRKHFAEPGVGGSLVGVKKSGDPLVGRFGARAAVTATLDFRGVNEAALSLHDPEVQRAVRIDGATALLAADFSAPIASFPYRSETVLGLLAMIFAERFSAEAGLYMVGPYHPDRLPVVLVHGLLSTPQMWSDVINEIEGDPELRGRVQFWVFWYPTGTPITFNALKLREELATAHRRYGLPHGVVLVGHSMGGLLARLQVTDPGRAIWDNTFKKRADLLYRKVPADSFLKRAAIFSPNPDVKREVFICTPHRGSEMALGSIGYIGRKLISLPATLVFRVEKTLGIPLELVFGKGNRLPTSIDGLSPRSPLLTALDGLPILAPHHSVVGDRGRGDTPGSSDGTVPYRSSHLDSALSELVVPGPHGAYALPQTIEELRRILKLHLSRK